MLGKHICKGSVCPRDLQQLKPGRNKFFPPPSILLSQRKTTIIIPLNHLTRHIKGCELSNRQQKKKSRCRKDLSKRNYWKNIWTQIFPRIIFIDRSLLLAERAIQISMSRTLAINEYYLSFYTVYCKNMHLYFFFLIF